jgi:hypothetical protein
MIVLQATSETLQAVLGGTVATNQLQCFSSWRDVTTTTYVPGNTPINTNNTSDVNLVPAPGASTQRLIDYVSVYNADTAAATVTIKLDVSGTERILWRGSLAVGFKVEYVDGAGFRVLNASGVEVGVGNTGAAGTNGTNGALSVTEAEIDLGADPNDDFVITVIDAAIVATHNIIVVPSAEASSTNDEDEAEMDSLLMAAVAGTGQFTLYVRAIPGPVSGRRKINYQYS